MDSICVEEFVMGRAGSGGGGGGYIEEGIACGRSGV